MRILFINTTDTTGGAAIAMQRLMKGLNEHYETKNFLLVKTKSGTAENTQCILTNKGEIIAEKLIDKVSRPAGLLYQAFPFSSRNILKAAKTFKPDIINLHNTHGAYFATPLIPELSAFAPIVWTLHDMWSFTANASHTFGNMSWKFLKNDPLLTKIPPSIGVNLGSFLLRQKKRLYQKANLTIVTPSIWLKELAKQSPLFEGKEILQIYNGIDANVFYPYEKSPAKHKLGLPSDVPTIMFSSHSIDKKNPWKGGNDLLEILRRMNNHATEKINFIVVGEGRLTELYSFSNFNIFYKGYIHNDEEMKDCLNASDLFIYPTRADNLPNVLVEAMACGTPCISFDIGGNSEIIKSGYNGFIIQPFDFDSFVENTRTLLFNKSKLMEFSRNCVLHAQRYFLIKPMVDSYYDIFKQLTK